MANVETVDEYIASFPAEVRDVLERIRNVIRKAAPETEEKISYRIPTVILDGRYLIYFAGWKQHVSLYPIHPLDEPLEGEISRYRSGQDTLRFPLKEPIPYDLVERIVAALVKRRLG